MVVQRDIARQLDAGLGCLGQAGLELDDFFSLLGSIGSGHAGQFQHLGHVGLVGLQLVCLGRVGIEGLVRQAQAALAGVGHVHGRVLEVGFGAEAEQHVLTLGGAGAQVVGNGGLVLQAIDRSQVGLQRLDALGVDLGFVHAGGPQVADDLLDAGRVLDLRDLLGQLVLHGHRTLVEDGEGAPAGAVARNLVGGQPLAVDVVAEGIAGIQIAVQIAGLEGVVGRQLALVELVGGGGVGRGRRGGGGILCRGFVLAAADQRGRNGQGQQHDLGSTGHLNGLQAE
ncbi:hypothetical protein D3C72_868270 [compost metagenome]